MVMVHFNNVLMEKVVFGNINVASIEDESFFQIPVFQSFSEGLRATMQNSFKDDANFRVICLGILDTLLY